ncbi:hypothetical protein Tco_1530890 [Tanacetum coccineum]
MAESSSHNPSSPKITHKEELVTLDKPESPNLFLPIDQIEFIFEDIAFTTNNELHYYIPCTQTQNTFGRCQTSFLNTLDDTRFGVSTPTGGIRGDIGTNEESRANDISKKIKLEDLPDLLKDTRSAFFTPDSPQDEPIIVSDESEEEEEVAKDRDTHASSHEPLISRHQPAYCLLATSLKPVFSKLLASHDFASCLLNALKELPSKFTELSREIKELKKHVQDMEIELCGDLKEIPTKLETFTSTISSLSSHVAKLKEIFNGEILMGPLKIGKYLHFSLCSDMGDDVNINTLPMEQYLALIQDNIRPGIVKPEIDGDVEFEINGHFMRDLRCKLFKGTDDEDAHKHMRRVLENVDLFHFLGVTHDAVMLRVFPNALTGPTLRWKNRISAGLITTWSLLEKVFIRLYCLPFKTAVKFEKICNFKQEMDEPLYHAWERESINDSSYNIDIQNLKKVDKAVEQSKYMRSLEETIIKFCEESIKKQVADDEWIKKFIKNIDSNLRALKTTSKNLQDKADQLTQMVLTNTSERVKEKTKMDKNDMQEPVPRDLPIEHPYVQPTPFPGHLDKRLTFTKFTKLFV